MRTQYVADDFIKSMSYLTFDIPSKAGDTKIVSNLSGSGKAFALAQIMNTKDETLLCLVDSPLELEQLATDLDAYRHRETWDILIFPDWETLPWDNFSPHEDIISERLAVLKKLQSNPKAIVLTTAANISHRLAPTSAIQGGSFDWHVGQPVCLAP